MVRTSTAVLGAFLLAAAPVTAQIRFGEIGFSLVEPTGASTGDGCWGFTCTPHRLGVTEGTLLDSVVRAPLGGAYIVFVGLGSGACANLPGAYNQLVIDLQLGIAPLFLGIVDQPNSVRWCYDGLRHDALPIPFGLAGFSLVLQAAAQAPNPANVDWVWSSAIILDIR